MSITYLIGAGASAKSLPLVANLAERMTSQSKRLKKPEYDLGDDSPQYHGIINNQSYKMLKDGYMSNLEWLKNECSMHSSIDTYAKKLYLKNEENLLNRLKTTVAVFFTIEQLMNTYDLRYDSFFASILNNSVHKFPDGMKIVSWNYDFQFEQCYKILADMNLPVHSKGQHLNPLLRHRDTFLFKLNGSSQIHKIGPSHSNTEYFCDFTKGMTGEQLRQMLLFFHWSLTQPQKCKTGISFAWEADEFINYVADEVKNTKILVVIGYSFPFFNREVDRKIIKGMEGLKKVYLQSPDAESLSLRFSAIQPKDGIVKVPISYTDQFYLPDEL